MDLPSSAWSLSSSSVENRDSLIHFWLTAPADQLETFWSMGFGSRTKDFVRSLTRSHSFSAEQIALRSSIGNAFDTLGLQHSLAPQLMVANFLLSPPGLLTINNIDSFFPDWLASAYHELYEVDGATNSRVSVTSLETSDPDISVSNDNPSLPDFGTFPNSLALLIDNRIHLNRILGLSNLYYIDPEDQEIAAELKLVRSSLAAAIDNSPESDLQYYCSTDFGDRYWSLVRSGIQKEPLSDADLSIKEDVVRRLNPDLGGGFGVSGSLNAFLIAMMYFLPGTMQIAKPQEKLPSWLLDNYKQIFDINTTV